MQNIIKTKVSANLPNQYFIMLEKQESHQEVLNNLQLIDKINSNLKQSIATIKTSIIELMERFLKSKQREFCKSLQQTIAHSYDKLHDYCVQVQANIQKKLFIYNPAIEQLNKDYKQQSQQVQHYRKKLNEIRKGNYTDSKQEMQRFNRNIEKKCAIQDEWIKTQKILKNNYECFRQESEEYIKIVPFQLISKVIQSTLVTSYALGKLNEDEKPRLRAILRQKSYISSVISQISDCEDDFLSEYSENEFKEQQAKKQNSTSGDRWKNIEDQLVQDQLPPQINKSHTFALKSGNGFKSGNTLKSGNALKSSKRKSMTKNSWIPDKGHTCQQIFQQIKRHLEVQTQNVFKNEKIFQIQKAFLQIKPSLKHQDKIKMILANHKNKFSSIKVQSQVTSKDKYMPFKQFHDERHQHQKTFVSEKQQFDKGHNMNSQRRNEKHKKIHLKRQFTLNQPFDEEQNTQTQEQKSQAHQKSLKNALSFTHSPSDYSGPTNFIALKPEGINAEYNKKHNKLSPSDFQKLFSVHLKQKHQKFKKPEMKIEIKQTTLNISDNKKQFKQSHKPQGQLSSQKKESLQNSDKKLISQVHGVTQKSEHRLKQKVGHEQKKQMVERLFALSSSKIEQIQQKQIRLQNKETHKRHNKAKHPYSTNYLPQMNNVDFDTAFSRPLSNSQIQTEQEIAFCKKSQSPLINRIQNSSQSPSSQRILDFSIFQKIV